jgi:phosphoenolpyruvate synthase/pyruvate phosphate dikinase
VTLVVTLATAGTDPAGPGRPGRADVSVIGGKGASLGELARAGAAVPPGFVVTVEAFEAAMAVTDPSGAHRAEMEALPATDLAGIASAAAAFRALVTGAALPAEVAAAIEAGYAGLAGTSAGGASVPGAPDVAVRSSATVEDSAEASFAGLQDTYLGIRGAAAVLEHVRRCWASLYNDESVAYRRRLRLPESEVAMAVVVQRMVAPRAAGVMFTRSPVSGDRSVVAIEAVWGLGSALVSGDVTPDSWVISKITGEITTRRVSPKVKIHTYGRNGIVPSPPPSPGSPAEPGDPVRPHASGAYEVAVIDTPPELRDSPSLTDDEIRALAAVGRRVEAHYGAPQDIEWALLDGPFVPAPEVSSAPEGSALEGSASEGSAESRIVLLQSRPETVWAARESKPAGAPKARAADHVLALFGKPR